MIYPTFIQTLTITTIEIFENKIFLTHIQFLNDAFSKIIVWYGTLKCDG